MTDPDGEIVLPDEKFHLIQPVGISLHNVLCALSVEAIGSVTMLITEEVEKPLLLRTVEIANNEIRELKLDPEMISFHKIKSPGSETLAQYESVSGIDIPKIAEPYIRRRAIRHLEKDRIVIIAGGTGNPFFSTDSAAALRAAELNCDLLIKGTKVDGVYESDPKVNSNAQKFNSISFSEVLEKELAIMDLTAITLCKENKMPILVLDITKEGNLFNALSDNNIGTTIS